MDERDSFNIKEMEMPDKTADEMRNMTTRSLQLRVKTVDEKQRSVEAILNTENAVQVLDWERWEVIDEILLADGMRFHGDQVVMLDSHRRSGTENVIGSIRDIRTEGSQNIGRLVFASDDERAERVWNLVRQGHLTDVSVGYRVDEAIDLKPGTSIKIGARDFKNDGKSVMRISQKWTLREASPVPIGANEEAKVREAIEANKITKVEPETKREIDMPEPKEIVGEALEIKVDTTKIEAAAADKAGKERAAEVNEIFTLAGQWDMNKEAAEAIREGKSLDQFRAMILDKKTAGKAAVDTQRSDIGLTPKETEKYNLGRAIRSIITGRPQDAPFEREVTEATAKTQGRKFDGNTILVPNEVMHRINHIDPQQAALWGQRAMTIASGGTGLVGTEHLSGSFIDMLRNRIALTKLGARVISGLSGNISIPKQTGASTFEWVTEGGSVTGGDPAFGSVTGSPKTGRGKVSFSRELLLQGLPSVDGLVLDDLAMVTALGFDLGGISGDGTSGAPTGILETSGIGDVIGTTFDWEKLVEFETDVRAANGDVGSMAYLTNATVNGLLKTREKSSGYPVFLAENGMANGYPVEVSNQVPANTMIFGVFSQALLALWGVLAIEVDIYTAADAGNVVIRSFQSGDWLIRQAAAFSASDEIG